LIGKGGKDIAESDALAHVAGYGIGIDLTLRDVQNELKKKGLPWEVAKGFDTACPLSEFVPAEAVKDPQQLDIRLTVNDVERQHGSTALMIHTVARLISHISGIFTLEPGDIILTGTPAGVSAIKSGDTIEAELRGLCSLRVTVA
jgi:5-carboxymethyl-2-hydroxymuconate isomerase